LTLRRRRRGIVPKVRKFLYWNFRSFHGGGRVV